MIGLTINEHGELITKIGQLPAHLQEMVLLKMQEAVDLLYAKVLANLSGDVLHVKTGDLVSRLMKGVEQQGSLIIGFVEIEPKDIKAFVQEYGGKGSYLIEPVKAQVLRFISKGGETVFAKSVLHPPLPERSYLRSALKDLYPVLLAKLNEAPEAVAHE
jgi:hypothetical protein